MTLQNKPPNFFKLTKQGMYEFAWKRYIEQKAMLHGFNYALGAYTAHEHARIKQWRAHIESETAKLPHRPKIKWLDFKLTVKATPHVKPNKRKKQRRSSVTFS